MTTANVGLAVVDNQGFALDGATVTATSAALSSQEPQPTATAAAGTTDADGRLSFEVDNGAPVIVRVSRDGHAEQTRRIDLPAGATQAEAIIALRRLEAPVVLADAENGGGVSGRDGAGLSIPAGAFVDANGDPVTGDVNVFMSPVDVTDERAIRAFPGEFRGIDDTGATSDIASLGVADFRFFQGAGELALADGQTATIRIPLYVPNGLDGSALAAGASIPLWSLDEATGIWQQEGFGTVVDEPASPTGLVLEGEVGHFSPWNADLVLRRDDAPDAAEIRVRIACGSSGTACDASLPPANIELVASDSGGPRFRRTVSVPVDSTRTIAVASGIALELNASGVGGAFFGEVNPGGAFTLASGEERDVEVVLRPLREGKRTFLPGVRLRGEMTGLGETHDYQFAVRADETVSVAGFAAESLFAPVGSTGELGGRLTLLDENGDIVASEVFDAFQVARLDVPVASEGIWTVRVEAEGKVPGFYVITTGLRPVLIGREYIKPSVSFELQRFGRRIAMDGNTLVVAGETGEPTDAVTVFERDPTLGWRQVAELFGGAHGDGFGAYVAIDGDTIAVGADGDANPLIDGTTTKCSVDGPVGVAAGAVHVYRRQGDGSWAREACIKPPDPEAGVEFGRRVAISGDTLVASSPRDTPDGTVVVEAGLLHIYVRDADNEWSLQQTIFPEAARPDFIKGGSELGRYGLAIDGDTIVATDKTGRLFSGLELRGEVHVFERGGGAWTKVQSFNPERLNDMQFVAAAISGERFVIGAPSNDDAEQGDQNRGNSGAVHVYERDGSGEWANTAFLKPPINDAGDFFGHAVDLAGDDLVVGAWQESSVSAEEPLDNSFTRAGAAYVLRRGSTGQWTFTEFLKAIDPDQSDDFGIAVAIGRSSIAVGARNDSGVDGDPESDAVTASGAVYVFPR